ncbi:MAG: tRNA (adenosine(37)-N6)-dimethylallyltransferase MiaA [Oscillospiraceae bacterium]|nr:tRNA (adenosine(37)-N6)-dimethylallyltransferase MiaA [Oscillospiraceae bacterium]
MSRFNKLIVICGPTASGKTSAGVGLAKSLGAQVVSADSMQIYKGMDIATAKPTHLEMQNVPHHLIGYVDRDKGYSVASYLNDARAVIAQLHRENVLPIVVGGTGLYISSLVDNIIFDEQESDKSLRLSLQKQAEELGNEAMLERLRVIDPEAASTLHPNNLNRILRALEIYEQTGVTITEQKRRSKLEASPYDCLMLGIDYADRSVLYERINRRVDIMIGSGLLDEAKNAYEQNCLGDTSAQAIGLKELVPYFEGNASLDEAIEKIKMETRRYAKRQLTWFRRDKRINWVICDENTDCEKILENFRKIIAKNNFL